MINNCMTLRYNHTRFRLKKTPNIVFTLINLRWPVTGTPSRFLGILTSEVDTNP